MTAFLLGPILKYLIGAFGGIAALFALYAKGRSAGAQRERDKRAREELKARDIRDQVQNDIGAMPPDKVKKELLKWAKK